MLLVVGATGDLGSRVVRRLREHGQDVRCLVRSGSPNAALDGDAVGDLTQPDTLAAACDGVDTVVATATAIARRLADRHSPSIHDVDEVGMSALVAAAEAAGVRRFVYVSFVGAEAALGTPLESAKLAIEKRLTGSPMETVIVRADAFQEIHLGALGRFDVANGKIAVIGKGDTKRRWIATEDVATLVAAVAVETDPPAMIEVGGPEAITKNEAIAIAEEATGRRMKVQHMPRIAARIAIRLLDRSNDGLASAFGGGLLQDLCPATWDDAALRERGIHGRPASAFLREQARPTF